MLNLALLFYFCATLLLSWSWFSQVKLSNTLRHNFGVSFASLGIIAQSFGLYFYIYAGPQINLSILVILTLLLAIVTFFLVISNLFFRHIPLLPAILLTNIGFTASVILLHPAYQQDNYADATVTLHIILSLAAFACVAIAFIYALQMRFIHARLKSKAKLADVINLPPLMSVEKLMLKMVTLGVSLLGFSLLSGFLYTNHMFTAGYGHKTLFSIGAFCTLLVLVIGERIRGWRITTMISLSGLSLLMLSVGYFGSRIVKELIL